MMKKTIFVVMMFVGSLFQVMSQTKNRHLTTKDTINDRDIVYPVDMERNYDQALAEWSREMKYGDDCNVKIDADVDYPDSVYINRLYALPTSMEMVFNPVVKDYIKMYSGRRRNLVSFMLGEGKYFYPMFEEALDKENLPLELKYLPVIESALNPIARSRVGASGLWQFMAGTGRMYDLEINSLVDERRDPQKSTEAAAKYLKDLYGIYGDWNLVIAAYNCGPGNVNKAIRRSGGLTDYWAIYPYLPRETRGYVPAFIAATYIMNYYKAHNICPAVCTRPASLDTLYVDNKVHFQQITDVINIPIEDLRAYNPQFKKDIIPGDYKKYALNLPVQKVSTYIEKKDAIYAYNTKDLLTHRKVAGLDVIETKATIRTHRVRRGETLNSIAQKYGITVNQLKKWNGLKSNSISVGRQLTVGVATSRKADIKEEIQSPLADTASNIQSNYIIKTTKQLKSKTSYYKIKKGDNITKIAGIQGVSVSDIKKWNNLKTNNLIVGKTLRIEKKEYITVQDTVRMSEPEMPLVLVDSTYLKSLVEDYLSKIERDASSLPLVNIVSDKEDEIDRRSETNSRRIIYHKVRIGETIPRIAARYNVSKDEIITWNKLTSNIARVGQRLLIRLPEKKDADNNLGSVGVETSTLQ